MAELREQFQRDLAEVSWKDLRIHLQRDAVILVDPTLDLVDTAVAVAEDDKLQVESWLAEGLLKKPDAAQIKSWETDLEKPFRVLIVQPFILTQSVNHA